jgi:hypothetical protein
MIVNDEASITYKYNNAQSVKEQEDHLKSELTELKREIETNELVHGIAFTRPFTSVPIPSDTDVLARERKFYIEKLLKVPDTRKPYIQADLIREQIEIANKLEFTLESLPLIMHQFFVDKMSWSIQAKHLHLLRWKRFSEHTSIIEDMFVDFRDRMGYLTK